MPKQNKKAITDSIIKMIEQGIATEKICSVICSKFQFTERTFYNHYKNAQEQHRIRHESIKKELMAVDTQSAIEARKKAIMTSDDRKELLTKIATGEFRFKKPFVINGKIMEYSSEPDVVERMKAIAELNKMEGDYAPSKVDHTTKGEKVEQQVTIFQLPDNARGDE